MKEKLISNLHYIVYCLFASFQIQAVLLGSLSQHNSILWILVAIDRYIFATRRRFYSQLAPSKVSIQNLSNT